MINMQNDDKATTGRKQRLSGFDYLAELIGWLQIVVSPLIAGLAIAALVYFPNPTGTRLVVAVLVIAIGLIIGIVFASRVWKKKGTIHFISRINASPELDDVAEDEKSI